MPHVDAKEITDTLIREIDAHIHPIGSCLPTRQELAKRFGVARGTVDRAVRNLDRRGMVRSYRRAGSLVVGTSRVTRIALVNGGAVGALVESHDGIVCTPIPRPAATSRADLQRLLGYDGILWHLPSKEQMSWAAKQQGRIPQVLTNREPPDLDFVSTDHAGAVYAITHERLASHPGWQPVFLDVQTDKTPGVVSLRRDGFVQACREHDVFYDLIALPDDFNTRLNLLRTRLGATADTPRIVVSASLQNTGAFMVWARETEYQWGVNLLYNDFDNDVPEHVWGLRVTSLLQDYDRMRTSAMQALMDRIHGKTERVELLLDALRRDGDT